MRYRIPVSANSGNRLYIKIVESPILSEPKNRCMESILRVKSHDFTLVRSTFLTFLGIYTVEIS